MRLLPKKLKFVVIVSNLEHCYFLYEFFLELNFFSIQIQQFLFTTWWIRSLSILAIEYTAKWVQTHIKTKFNEHVYCVETRILYFFYLSLKINIILEHASVNSKFYILLITLNVSNMQIYIILPADHTRRIHRWT